MKKTTGLYFFLLLGFHFSLTAQNDTLRNRQTDTIIQRIILVGDGGELTADKKHPVAEAIKNFIQLDKKLDKKTTVLFLGWHNCFVSRHACI